MDPESFEELRQLLLGPEQALLRQLLERLGDPQVHTRMVSAVLPQAISIRSNQDRQLGHSLMPAVEEILGASVKRNPQKLASVLFPIMGPAIRKAIYDAFQQMIQSFSKALESGFSRDGLKWRIEAMRTGKPFAEIVLLHNLLFRVEQVFLIHRESGLMLQHLVGEEVDHQDADMVSGMLTAVQDFVHDSFGGDEGDALDNLQYGDLKIWVIQGPLAVLACAVRGNAPEELRIVFQEILESIHLENRDQLEYYDGEVSKFAGVRPQLEDCLQSRYQDKSKRIHPFVWVILFAVVCLLSWWGYLTVRDHLRWTDYIEALEKEPGIVVTSEYKRGGKYHVFGLRDPMAADPKAILQKGLVKPEDVVGQWEAYQALDDRLITKRLQEILKPPPSVKWQFRDGVLTLSGSAPAHWVETTKVLASAVPGVNGYQDRGLISTPPQVDFYVQKLDREPGIVVVSTEKRGGKYHIFGLRDPLAADPAGLLQDSEFSKKNIVAAWESYQSLDEEIVRRRIDEKLSPPVSVNLDFDRGILTASGEAEGLWIQRARNLALGIAGVKRYDDRALVDGKADEFKEHKQWMEQTLLHFEENAIQLNQDEEKRLAEVAVRIKELHDLAGLLDQRILVEITGHADATGNESHNLKLSRQRAVNIKTFLTSHGIKPSALSANGIGSSEPLREGDSDIDRSYNRRVSFKVVSE